VHRRRALAAMTCRRARVDSRIAALAGSVAQGHMSVRSEIATAKLQSHVALMNAIAASPNLAPMAMVDGGNVLVVVRTR
jgi:hypothetical protein